MLIGEKDEKKSTIGGGGLEREYHFINCRKVIFFNNDDWIGRRKDMIKRAYSLEPIDRSSNKKSSSVHPISNQHQFKLEPIRNKK